MPQQPVSFSLEGWLKRGSVDIVSRVFDRQSRITIKGSDVGSERD